MEIDCSVLTLLKITNNVVDSNLENLASDTTIMFYSFINIFPLDPCERLEKRILKEESIRNRIIVFTVITAKEIKWVSRRT